MNPAAATPSFFRRLKPLHWFFIGLAVVSLALFVGTAWFLLSSVGGLDMSRELDDFASEAEARAFVSAHLPAPLPEAAVVKALSYERWTDWRLEAKVELATAQATEAYLSQVASSRRLDQAYCGADDPAQGLRYFLAATFACGSVERVASQQLRIQCQTR